MLIENKYVIGVDYGTDSVRSLIVDAANGNEIASSVFYYPRWKKGLYCNAAQNQFRQHPLDYTEGLENTIKDCLQKAGVAVAQNVKAISIDTTGSTPVAVNKNGTPLCMLQGFEENVNAMFVLWKDHTATKEADEINKHAVKFDTNYLQFVGGIYSSEWFWAKLLHILREDETILGNIYSFVEHCDWIPFVLTGGNDASKIKRGVCSAGHKALWADNFGGLPTNEFFKTLDPLLDGFTQNLFIETYTADKAAGIICEEWASKLGLPYDVLIGVGAFDCHMGAVGGQIEPYYLSKVMGTSTCDMLVAPLDEVKNILVKGICGQVNGSIIPGMMGMEAGQSAFGDVYAWFKNILAWPINNFIEDENNKEKITDKIIIKLAEQAANIELLDDDEIGIDWMNGRRTPDANQLLKGAIANINLASDAPRIFKSLVEATCFGSKAIVDRFIDEGIDIKGIIALGGVAQKSTYVMQTLANILNMPIRVHKSEQTCALGASMFAATVAGIYNKVEDAMAAMGQGFEKIYEPQQDKVAYYEKRYKMYKKLGAKIETN
jgi:L-ribulokinase